MIIIDETQFLMQITIKDMQKLQQIFLKEVIPEEVYYYKWTFRKSDDCVQNDDRVSLKI